MSENLYIPPSSDDIELLLNVLVRIHLITWTAILLFLLELYLIFPFPEIIFIKINQIVKYNNRRAQYTFSYFWYMFNLFQILFSAIK